MTFPKKVLSLKKYFPGLRSLIFPLFGLWMDFLTLSNFRTIKQKYGLSFLSKFIFANSTKMFWLLLKEAWCFISCFCLGSLLHIVSAFGLAWPFSSSFYILTLLSHSKSVIDFFANLQTVFKYSKCIH